MWLVALFYFYYCICHLRCKKNGEKASEHQLGVRYPLLPLVVDRANAATTGEGGVNDKTHYSDLKYRGMAATTEGGCQAAKTKGGPCQQQGGANAKGELGTKMPGKL